MAKVRIAVASTPLTVTLEEAVPAAVDAIAEAGRLGASVVCLPETAVPGHRGQSRHVPAVTNAALEEAWRELAAAAAAAGVAAIVSSERMTDAGREIVALVFDANGALLGEQSKTQIDPSEERDYVPGRGRRVFRVGDLRFGIAICHEAFRYPEISRSLALGGAHVIFVPHYVTTDDGTLPTQWCAPSNPYNEKALLCRALENHVFVAQANNSGPDQGSATCIVAPDGRLLASLAYGPPGVIAADIELELADARLARRWAPERNVLA